MLIAALGLGFLGIGFLVLSVALTGGYWQFAAIISAVAGLICLTIDYVRKRNDQS
ncbi:hypothetical protein CMUST_10775 [Corynebacterium mustelae]|uniref:Uncharacterized protein n=1 Tax=Corynebacterium mustelae TaxID=571915 RepID=A0A0G3GZ76_9CORY|nr:hypothetical protein [Corynebacterium mustelae]AKK06471.1 hypothetical protein CMUST_10775 [Corynebacterium mustelae]